MSSCPLSQAITTCLYGAGTTPRLQQQGMELAVWVFKHSAPQQLEPAAPAILEGCLNLLDTGGKGLAYQYWSVVP